MELITSKEMYDQALGLFQVEIKRAGRGYLVFVTDENGNPIRHPVRMSDFEERPRFYLSEDQIQKNYTESLSNKNGAVFSSLKTLIIKELIWQMQQQFNDGTLGKRGKYKLKGTNNKRKRGRRL